MPNTEVCIFVLFSILGVLYAEQVILNNGNIELSKPKTVVPGENAFWSCSLLESYMLLVKAAFCCEKYMPSLMICRDMFLETRLCVMIKIKF